MIASGLSYTALQALIIRHHGSDSMLATAVGRDFKGKLSVMLYAVAIYAAVALLWVIPDRRIEAVLRSEA